MTTTMTMESTFWATDSPPGRIWDAAQVSIWRYELGVRVWLGRRLWALANLGGEYAIGWLARKGLERIEWAFRLIAFSNDTSEGPL